MNVFLIIFILAIVNFLVQLKHDYKLANYVLLILMFCLCAFRMPWVGADTYTYLQIYTNPTAIESYHNEFIFYWLVKILYYFDAPVWIIQILMTLLIYVPFGIAILKYSPKPALSILIFVIASNNYFPETFNITRQVIATGFLLLSWVAYSRQELKVGLIYYFIAVGFHSTSLIYAPLAIFAFNIRYNISICALIILATLCFAFIFSSVSIITGFISKLGAVGMDKYSEYASYQLGMARTKFGLINDLLPVCTLGIYCLLQLKDGKFLVKLFCTGLICLNIISVMPTAYRMMFGITSLEILLYPMCYVQKSQYKWVISLLIIFLCVMWVYKMPFLEGAKLLPYESGITYVM